MTAAMQKRATRTACSTLAVTSGMTNERDTLEAEQMYMSQQLRLTCMLALISVWCRYLNLKYTIIFLSVCDLAPPNLTPLAEIIKSLV